MVMINDEIKNRKYIIKRNELDDLQKMIEKSEKKYNLYYKHIEILFPICIIFTLIKLFI